MAFVGDAVAVDLLFGLGGRAHLEAIKVFLELDLFGLGGGDDREGHAGDHGDDAELTQPGDVAGVLRIFEVDGAGFDGEGALHQQFDGGQHSEHGRQRDEHA